VLCGRNAVANSGNAPKAKPSSPWGGPDVTESVSEFPLRAIDGAGGKPLC